MLLSCVCNCLPLSLSLSFMLSCCHRGRWCLSLMVVLLLRVVVMCCLVFVRCCVLCVACCVLVFVAVGCRCYWCSLLFAVWCALVVVC